MTKTYNPELLHIRALLHRFCRLSTSVLVLFLLVWLAPSPVSALGPQALKSAVFLLGANSTNDALLIPVSPGADHLDLYLQTDKALQIPQGKLIVTKFMAQTPPGEVVSTRIYLDGAGSGAVDGKPVPVLLTAPGLIHVILTHGKFRPGATYKGYLFLAADGQMNRWELTLPTGGLGTMAVEHIGTMKFTTLPWEWLRCLFHIGDGETFPVTLYDKSGGGPYHDVHVRFEPLGNTLSKAIVSNLTLDSFSFRQYDETKSNIDLAQGNSGIDVAYLSQYTFTARIKALSPGEYTGTLHFVSADSSNDAPDAKLPLTIQVRHLWILPVLVIIFGSLLGWFSTKFVVGVRKAHDLIRKIKELQARADALARAEPRRTAWEFPGEETSYGLAKVRAQLSSLYKLASSGFLVLWHEEEFKIRLDDAGKRVDALERLRSMRLELQEIADGRPAAQLTLGRLLRCASSLIERPGFGQNEQTDLSNLQKTASAWKGETFLENYREALTRRLESEEVPQKAQLGGLQPDEVREALDTLLTKYCPTTAEIKQTDIIETLQQYDRTIAKLALLWREREQEWAKELSTAAVPKGECLENLFEIVDKAVWERLKTAADQNQLNIKCDSTSQKAYHLAEFNLRSQAEGLSDYRIRRHPLHVIWHIDELHSNARSAENHDLTLVNYFPRRGKVNVGADLHWQDDQNNKRIHIPKKEEIVITRNWQFSRPRAVISGLTELLVLVIAAGFAVASALATQYDATFGSFTQYLTLFLWAAGAGTVGNIFKQLGATSTPGGQPDVSLAVVK